MKSFTFVIIALVLFCSAPRVLAQTLTQDDLVQMAKSGAFDNMSVSDIKQKLQEAGVTQSEAIQYAKQQGIDISKYFGPGGAIDSTKLKQMQGQQMQPQGVFVPMIQNYPAPESLANRQPQFPEEELEKKLYPDTSLIPRGQYDLEYFGYNMFKRIPTAFEPNNVGPIDPGYLVGPGDELLLSVWGQAEFQYELEVDREGRVFIPNVGEVFVIGIPLRDLQSKLSTQLSKYYSGLASQPPTVFLDVTITKLRPLRIFVMGEVTQAGGYTISSYATVFNALYAVGGPQQMGSLRGIKVIRDNKVTATVDLYDYLLKGDGSSDVRLQNNDVVFIPPRGKTVSVRGEVKRPAIFELKDNENFNSLLEFCGGLLPAAYTDKAHVDRIKPFDQRSFGAEDRVVVDVPLHDLVEKKIKDFPLYDGDDVRVDTILDEMRNFVMVGGSVWRPDRYALDKAPTVLRLIQAANGLQPKTFMPVAHIVRYNEDRLTKALIPFNLGDLMSGKLGDISLEPKDSVIIYSTEETEVKTRYVIINGEVKNPGKYELTSNMTLPDLILQAGGFTEEADLLDCEVSRVRPEGMTGDTLSIILHPKLPLELSRISAARVSGDSVEHLIGAETFLLQQRDEVLIRPNPNYRAQENVFVEGDITYPGVYALEKRGELLSDIINRAGGPTKTSYLGGAQFFRDKRILHVDFEEAYYGKDKLNDVLMHDSDKIIIPTSPHTVNVQGEVNNPGLVSFVKGESVTDYINRAGGLTDSSNYAIYAKPSGESERVNFGFLRSNPEVLEGSNITVTKVSPPPPQTGPQFDLNATIKDSFAILTSAATVAFIIYQVEK
jgi:protein involved in polysaccharide export with SLBB domain